MRVYLEFGGTRLDLFLPQLEQSRGQFILMLSRRPLQDSDQIPVTFARFISNAGDVCKIQRNDGVNFNKAPAKTRLCSENF